MTKSKTRLAPVLITALVAGWVGFNNWSTADVPPKPVAVIAVPTDRPYRGITLQVQSLDDLTGYEKSVDEIAATGADTINIVPQMRQENGASDDITPDSPETAKPEPLGKLIDYCREKKLRVSLMPIVILSDPRSNQWRGNIRPTDWNRWFGSYGDAIDSYAAIAQAHGVDLFVVGSELVSSQTRGDNWTHTIGGVRERFKGNITYSANWDNYTKVPFWDQLDEIGMNSYWTLGDGPDATVDQIKQNWVPIHDGLVQFAAVKKKPLIFLEAGWCSLSNAAKAPWNYTPAELPADDQLQEKLYEGFLSTWYGDKALAGFMIHEWIPGPVAEKGYSPQGKPAEAVLRKYLAQPAWKIETFPAN